MQPGMQSGERSTSSKSSPLWEQWTGKDLVLYCYTTTKAHAVVHQPQPCATIQQERLLLHCQRNLQHCCTYCAGRRG